MSEWLLQTLLATSGLTVLVLLIREPVRKRFGSRVTYALWMIPTARLFMPTLKHSVQRALPVQPSIQPLGDAFVREPLWMARVAPAAPSLIDRLGGWPTILLAVWFAVAASLFLSRMIAFCRDRRAILDSSLETTRLGSIRIVRTPEVLSPVALGILDRIIAVPSDFDARYGKLERSLVLEHELSHHRSGDLLANLFAFVLLCLQWFNPLAWVAHAAFRFDQEAACDARVLDNANADDRADYGRAIAKAASGRALLFASALDRRNSLKKRLRSMLYSPKPARRFAGRLLVVATIAVALPLTASHAIEYVDAPIPAAPAIASAASVASGAPAVAQPVRGAAAIAVAAQTPAAARGRGAAPQGDFDRDLSINGDYVVMDGKTKRWEDLTPAEKDRVRRAVADARASLAHIHLNPDEIMRGVNAATSQVRVDQIQGAIANAEANAANAVRGIDESAPYLRAAGQDPDRIKAAVDQSMRSVRNIDVSEITRQLAAIDPRTIAQSVKDAQRSVEAAKAGLNRIDGRLREDKRQ